MEPIVTYLSMVLKFTNSKKNILRFQQIHYVQEIFQKGWSADSMKITGFNGYFYDFSVDSNAIAVDDILNIHNYLIKKMTQCNKMFEFVKKCFFTALAFLSTLTDINSLSCISMNN